MDTTEQDNMPDAQEPEDALTSASSDDGEEEFHGSRTQVITPADLMSVEDVEESTIHAAGQAASEESKAAAPGRAHECLEIRTPIEEFETYVRARVDTLNKLGEHEQVDIVVRALELGKHKLAYLTGQQLPQKSA